MFASPSLMPVFKQASFTGVNRRQVFAEKAVRCVFFLADDQIQATRRSDAQIEKLSVKHHSGGDRPSGFVHSSAGDELLSIEEISQLEVPFAFSTVILRLLFVLLLPADYGQLEAPK